MTGTPAAPCVVGVADHAGWAHLVSVSARGGVPFVVERRKVTTIDGGVPTQPYHHDSLRLQEDEANALIARVRRSIADRTTLALRQLTAELAPAHHAVAIAIRTPPFPDLPATVADAWNTRLLYAADGMMYQLAFCQAARQLGLDVQMCPRGKEAARAAERLAVEPGDIEAFVTHAGRPAGPPWTEEHRRAYAAAIAVLAARTRNGLSIR